MRAQLKAAAFLFLSLGALAQDRPTFRRMIEQPREVQEALGVTAVLEENQIRSGLDARSEGHLLVNLQIEARRGFRVYDDRIQMGVARDEALGAQQWKTEILTRPPSIQFLDPVTKKMKSGYRGQSVFRLKLSLPGRVRKTWDGRAKLPLEVTLQACDDRVCLLPAKVLVDLSFSKVPPPAPASTSFLDGLARQFRDRLSENSFWTYVILFLAGLLTAFTPCVYPLFPITLGLFTRWSQLSHISAFVLSVAYCLGLTLSYACLGLVSALTGSVFGSLTQTPAFLLGVGLLILVSAVFFSGLVEFPMPAILNRILSGRSDLALPTRSKAKSLARAFGLGAGLGIVASPCVGPVLVVLLAWLSTKLAHASVSDYVRSFSYLSFFGIGMSFPFLILGLFIVKLHRRPSLGRYTPYFKHVGTVLMVGAAFAFLVPGWRLLRITERHGSNPEARKLQTGTLSEWDQRTWTIIDFRADWCAACVQLEEETFSHPKVAALFESKAWNLLTADLTQTTKKNEDIAREFGVVSLPSVLIYGPGPKGKLCASESLHGFEDADDFLARLERAKAHCE